MSFFSTHAFDLYLGKSSWYIEVNRDGCRPNKIYEEISCNVGPGHPSFDVAVSAAERLAGLKG